MVHGSKRMKCRDLAARGGQGEVHVGKAREVAPAASASGRVCEVCLASMHDDAPCISSPHEGIQATYGWATMKGGEWSAPTIGERKLEGEARRQLLFIVVL
ncbi:hypothetical protein CaCOL14_000666 [Colletotrichum acutatum]